MNNNPKTDMDMTLDPPGSIAIVGAGTHGIEAGLYGRFLGYDVTILERGSIGNNMRNESDADLVILPDQCLSPLALSAVATQHAAENPGSSPLVHPTTVSAWIEEGLVPLSESDLLRGRIKTEHLVTSIDAVPIELENESEDASDYPADFQLRFTASDGTEETLRVEAVLIATGSQCDIEFMFPLPCPYLHRIESTSPDNAAGLLGGRRKIVEIYSQLAGRENLDLYRPPRV
ncbi:MAG: hypothetical protein ACR2N1_15330 [Rubripirellula sp.]